MIFSSLKTQTNELVREMAKSVLVKVVEDTDKSLKANFDDEAILPWTNRRQESLFAHAKGLMKRYPTLTVNKPLEIAIAKINNVGDWFDNLVSFKALYINCLFPKGSEKCRAGFEICEK